jgi:hypothetical protein
MIRYKHALVDGKKIVYREAGPVAAPARNTGNLAHCLL